VPSAAEDVRRQARRTIRRPAVRGRKLVLFGASLLAAQVKHELEQHGLTLDAVIDNDPDKVGRSYQGLTVQRPETVLVPHRDDCVVIVVAVTATREMLFQMESLGYARDRQAFVLSPTKFDESPAAFLRGVRDVLRGRASYRKLIGRDRESTLFVAPYAGTGDIYLICLYLKSFVERENIRSYKLAVASNACAQVARMMGETDVTAVDWATLNRIIGYGRVVRAAPHEIVVLNDGWDGAPTQWLRGFKGLDFEKMFRHAVFDFPDATAAQIPAPSATNDAVVELFDQQGLVPGRTVVLSPYANTLFHVPDHDFWGAVAARCAARGLTVCTNCAPTEEPIAGTVAARFPLALAADFVETAGYFVGVRSGFCDIVSATGSRMVILYDRDGRFYKGSFQEYFSLDAMGLGRNLLELEYGPGDEDNLVGEVLGGLT